MIKAILRKRELLLLFILLETLHQTLWSEPGTASSQAFLLIHLGVFLIWQPILLGSQKYTWYNALSFIALALLFTYAINWWLSMGWIILLVGMVAGRVITSNEERFTNFLVIVFLFLELFINCIPNLLLVKRVDYQVYELISTIIPFIPFLLLIIPVTNIKKTIAKVDLLQSITASLFTSLLALGTLVIMNRTQFDYFFALFQTLLLIGIGLMLISWLLSSGGAGGLAQLWSRSLLNIGTPFEQWLADMAQLKEEQNSAEDFLDAAIIKLVSLPWISGVKWGSENSLNIHGIKSRHKITMTVHEHPVTIYSDVSIKGALSLHCNLLIQLIEYMHESKLNEQQLARQARIQAVYETGARVTHDIKNLLQSMKSMMTILNADSTENKTHSLEILKKQFPSFIQRLEQSVTKLQSPGNPTDEKISIKEWSRELSDFYGHNNIDFQINIEKDYIVPFDLFETVAENLLDNAVAKKNQDPEIKITFSIHSDETSITMIITDTGHQVDEKIARQIFREPIKSDNGLGIGLMQSAQLAATQGYLLSLASNQDGNVSFRLSSQSG